MKITMAHGAGGEETGGLIARIFSECFKNPYLSELRDSALLPAPPAGMRIALTTDSFVVRPVFYPGGDIGRLAVCGTVNDLLMSGAKPEYLTAGFILEEGLEITELERIVRSMADTAREAGVLIVAGDTKVTEGQGGLIINTAGVGFVSAGVDIGPKNCIPGDALLLSGTLGDHHAALLGKRLDIEIEIESDTAPLTEMVEAMLEEGIGIHALRDVTRGGLATVCNELAESSGVIFELKEEGLPVSEAVRSFAGILGLDPLYMGNEGKILAVVEKADAERALKIIKESRYGERAEIIGSVKELPEKTGSFPGVILNTKVGGQRRLSSLTGEGLPRIC